MKVLLGVTGGIAAYKSAEIIRLLTEQGHEVRVLPTENALRFIGKTTLEALSHNPIDSNLYSDVADVKHIEVAQWADVVLVAPATAAFLARLANGIADDLLGNILLATKARVFVAPAMHTEMWENLATKSNVQTLVARGVHLVEPGVGRLTGTDSGVGRLAEPAQIVEAITASGSLAGKKVVITAGGTREPIDSVRFVGNYSSGKQGLAIAKAVLDAGAQVTLIAANLEQTPIAAKVVAVKTTAELARAVASEVTDADVLVMAAAVADFRVENPAVSKLKRSELGGELNLHLVSNPDVLASTNRPGLYKVGFAAETTEDLDELALAKLEAKQCDLLVANNVSNGAVFGSTSTAVRIYDKAGAIASLEGSKRQVAELIVAQISKGLR